MFQQTKPNTNLHEDNRHLLADQHCITWVKSVIQEKLTKHKDSSVQWPANAQRVVAEFLIHDEHLLLFAFISNNNQYIVSGTYELAKKNTWDRLLFILKDKPSEEVISLDNISTVMSYGILTHELLGDFLNLMKNYFTPELMETKSNWPESLQKDFLSQLHKFMAYLTETYYRSKGSTVLYVPNEDIDLENANNQKDLIQRLEIALMHWTSQIREVVSEKDSYGEHGDNARPLSEIEYWRSRADDLINIKKQIQREDVQKIVTVLSNSIYLSTFEKLSTDIQKGSDEALDNLKYLKTLQEPCEKLAKASPQQISDILPEILFMVQLINSNSNSYNTSERISGLLKKISNEIIHICTAKISLKDIFNGNVEHCMDILHQSIKAGDYWKNLSLEENESEGFNYDKSSVFSEIDAFVVRCGELLEVCEAQLQFGSFTASIDNTKNGLPKFGGTKGPEITKSLVDIRISFQKLINDLSNLKYPILDVKSTNWNDDYKKFKNGIKDLETMMQTVITNAFETVTDLQNGIELLEAFSYLAKRESIKRSIETKTQFICLKFIKELEDVQKSFELNRKNPPVAFIYPTYSGSALWAKRLQDRIKRDKEYLNKAHFLPRTKEHQEVEKKYQQVYSNLEKHILSMFEAWNHSFSGPELHYKLEIPLLVKVEKLLKLNFDTSLLNIFEEVKYWQRFSNFDISEQALEMYCYAEQMRLYRENVALVAGDYNSIITSLSEQETRLFIKYIKEIDKQILPGLHTLGWTLKMHNEHYLTESRKKCKDVKEIIKDFKNNVTQIYLNCKKMADTLLIKIENKKVYDGETNEFEREQESYRKLVKDELVRCHENIVNMMVKLYGYFVNGGTEIFEEWWAFVDNVERKIDQSLRLTVKKSLQKLLNSINGVDSEKNNEGHGINRNPLFLVRVDLKEENEDEVNPGLTPNIKEMMTMVTNVNGETTKIVSVVPRLKKVLKEKILAEIREDKPEIEEDKIDPNLFAPEEGSTNYYDKNIELDPDIIKSIVSIMEGMDAITSRVSENLNEWKESFKSIWSVDKDNFIRRFGIPHNRTAKSFEQEIEKYRQYHQDIQNKDPTMYIGYLQLDFAPLKQTLFMECNQWQSKLLDLLHANSKKELDKNYELFEKNGKGLREEPRNLEALEKKIELVARMDADYPKKKAGFAPLYDQYELLRNYDVKIDEREQDNLDNLSDNSVKFEELIEKAKGELENQKETFRMKLRANIDIFANSLIQLKSEFENTAPFSSQYSFKEAKTVLDAFRDKVESKKKEEERLKNGLKIFNMQPQQYKEIKDVSKSIESLEKVWVLKSEWDKTYDEWKYAIFGKLNIEEMETTSTRITSKLTSMGREVRDWGVYNGLIDKLNLVAKVLPLIQQLKNQAMRKRHWSELRDITKQDFEENSKEFNLEKIFKLNLENYVDDIANISNRASQELIIEQEIKKISDIWSNTFLDIVPYKDNYFKLQSTELIYMNLDDNIASLGSMKLNPFITSFQSDVKFWEETLAKINEVIDLLLLVQRQWIYLLNIFDVEDIQKQLHNEFGVFKSVNSSWKNLMKSLSDNRGILAIAKRDNINILLSEMNSKLELIQKQLDGYLELKRQEFPRFYFLSDDDLLQILGQSKDPNAIQRHLSNLFEGIKMLKIEKSSDSRQFGFFAKTFISKEGEQIEFNHPVPLEGTVEKWLSQVELSMKATIKRGILKCFSALKNYSQESSRESWIKEWPGQLVLLSSQLYWTKKIVNVLSKQKEPSKILKELKLRLKPEWMDYLSSYSSMGKDMKPLDRIKVISLITLEVHARDIIDRLIKSKVTSCDDFEWQKQMRVEWDEEKDGCVVKQGTNEIDYGYEYIGNCSRLVVTPLTEKCFLALTTAVQLKKGGCTQGPAGTGKSETVKELAKSVGKHTLILNCSDRFDYQSIAKTFSGIVQTGSWSCFDEFNRLELDVLSIVAQQILQILNAVSIGVNSFIFEGNDIKINPTCGIFVTMNPNYVGRTELPDNLKVLLRPVAMMAPDSGLICEIKLYSQGFKDTQTLSKKITTIYGLLNDQLSKQPHYDFGLRNICSLLSTAGEYRKNQLTEDEDLIIMMACRSMNHPKLKPEDVPIFNSIMRDMFPNKEFIDNVNQALYDAVSQTLVEQNYQVSNYIISKCVQLEEILAERHGVMLIGNTMSGKSTTWKVLQNSISRAFKTDIKEYVINPKSLSHDELYGNYDKSRDWKDGVFSSILREAVKDSKENKHHWIIFDGPIDTLWVESMNTLLDDTKMLTLISGDRIPLTPNINILFEVSDVKHASPGTISRCGMVYFNADELGWKPILRSWFNQRRKYEEKIGYPTPDSIIEFLSQLLLEKNYIQRVLDEKNQQHEMVHLVDAHAVKSFCVMFDAMATVENGLDPSDLEVYQDLIKKYLVFCLIWTIGASVDEEGRKRMDILFREYDPQFPSSDTVYEYYIDPKSKLWRPWNERVNTSWKMHHGAPFHKLIVPTIDTVRSSFIIQALLKSHQQVLLTGNSGVGKTAIIHSTLSQFDDRHYTTCDMSFCAKTDSSSVQKIVESKVEKSLDTYTPYAGKQMIIFADDFGMPEKDESGSQAPLELIRQYIDYGFWYDRSKCTVKKLKKVQVLAAMGPEGQVSNRLLTRFNVINIATPTDSQISRIYGTLISQRLEKLEEAKSITEELTCATLRLFKSVSSYLLPTPKKTHYTFNLRDLSRVFQGIVFADHESLDSKDQTLRLWVHECYRVFNDRLSNEDDRKWFRDKIGEHLSDVFGYKWRRLYSAVYDEVQNTAPSQSPSPGAESPTVSTTDYLDSDGIYKPTLFGDFITFRDKRSYVEMPSIEQIRQELDFRIREYNDKSGKPPLKIVLFNEAIEHICRIYRILKQSRGNALLIGVGGSGRQSLARLVTHMIGHKLVEFQISSAFSIKEFQETIKEIYWEAGFKGKEIALMFSDSSVNEDVMFENINSIISTGEVPNLFSGEEVQTIYDTCKREAIISGCNDLVEEVFQYFIEKVRNNIHIITCLNPQGKSFKMRMRMFPALTKYSTIDWFNEWPESALREVSGSFLTDISNVECFIQKDESSEKSRPNSPSSNKPHEQQKAFRDTISDIFVKVHNHVKKMSDKMKAETQKVNFVTPSNYLNLVKGFSFLLEKKRTEFTNAVEDNELGVRTLENTNIAIKKMKVQLDKQHKEVDEKKKKCDNLMDHIVGRQTESNNIRGQISVEKSQIESEREKANKLQEQSRKQLSEVEPLLEAAEEQIKNIDPNDIYEIKKYTNPSQEVINVFNVILVIMKKSETNWEGIKNHMSNPMKFLNSLIEYPKSEITERLLNTIHNAIERYELNNMEKIETASTAVLGLAKWAIAIEKYGRVYQSVKPKREALEKAERAAAEYQIKLERTTLSLKEFEKELQELGKQYEVTNSDKKSIENQLHETERKLSRAKEMTSALEREKGRWLLTIQRYKSALKNLVGDILLTSAFVSYAGPFTPSYRKELVNYWIKEISDHGFSVSSDYSVDKVLSKSTTVRDWTSNGLPFDNFSVENGVLVMTDKKKWPLMIDPQGQANNWIKKFFGYDKSATLENAKIIVTSLKDPKLMKIMEFSIKNGISVLLEDILENIDPCLAPIIKKSIETISGRDVLRLGDKLIDYNHNFRLFMTTKLSNPTYSPELVSNISIINFTVTAQGLEDQLLAILVKKEKPELEDQKTSTMLAVAAANKQLEILQSDILQALLSDQSEELLENEVLISKLQQSKKTSEEVTLKLELSQETEKKIDNARNQYREAARRASILYFVLYEIGQIDTMYQHSLDSYIELYKKSIDNSPKPKRSDQQIQQRIEMLNEYHTYEFYKKVCQGLFEKHKLLFIFHLCAKILQSGGLLNSEEYDFFLKGAQSLEKETPNPLKSWLPQQAWKAISDMDRIVPFFHGIARSFEEDGEDWRVWFLSDQPENDHLPSEWQTKVDDWTKMLIVRCVRPDRLINMIKSFIVSRMGSDKYIKPPQLDIASVYENDSDCFTPIIFTLAQNINPQEQIIKIATEKGIKINVFSLGRGQEHCIDDALNKAVRNGEWIFLANCHLIVNWLPKLDEKLETLLKRDEDGTNSKINPNFRIWLSSKPHPRFPISLLHRSTKIAAESPTGLVANMTRLFKSISPQQFQQEGSLKPLTYRRLFFALAYFHSVVVERSKFGSLGWSSNYDFNDSDFESALNVMNNLINKHPRIHFDALRYMIVNICYGGRVTDEIDKKILDTYSRQFFNDLLLDMNDYPLSLNDERYYVPGKNVLSKFVVSSSTTTPNASWSDPTLDHAVYMKFIREGMPQNDTPGAFGQTANAFVTSQIEIANGLLNDLLKITPQTVQVGSTNYATKVQQDIHNLVSILKEIPEEIDTSKIPEFDYQHPLAVVLSQECERYNFLIQLVRKTVEQLLKSVRGFSVMNPQMEGLFHDVKSNKVPTKWLTTYPSTKSLSSWIVDLNKRVTFFREWATTNTEPAVFWLSAFTHPQGFLTAVKQISARRFNDVDKSVDKLDFEFQFVGRDVSQITEGAREGVYIHGLILEGAGWEASTHSLTEPRPLQLRIDLPVVHIRAVPQEELKKYANMNNYFKAPVFMSPTRSGPNTMVCHIDLKIKQQAIPTTSAMFINAQLSDDKQIDRSNPLGGVITYSDHFVRRGTALLLQD